MENTGEKGSRGIRISRRGLLGKGMTVAAGVAASATGIGKAVDFISKVPTPEPLPPSEPSKKFRKIAYEQPDSEKPNLSMFKAEKIGRIPGFSEEEERFLDEIVDQQNSEIMSWEDVEDRKKLIPGYKKEIEEAAKELGIPTDHYIIKYFPSLMFIESGGNILVGSGVGALGLCQLMPNTAVQLAINLGILGGNAEQEEDSERIAFLTKPKIDPKKNPEALDQISEKNVYNKKTNIKLGLKYLMDHDKLFPERSLALWSYHLGQGAMWQAIDAYLLENLIPTIDNEEKKNEILKDIEKENSSLLVRKYNLNYSKLAGSTEVVNRLKNPEVDAYHDSTEIYFPRMEAARRILDGNRGKQSVTIYGP